MKLIISLIAACAVVASTATTAGAEGQTSANTANPSSISVVNMQTQMEGGIAGAMIGVVKKKVFQAELQRIIDDKNLTLAQKLEQISSLLGGYALEADPSSPRHSNPVAGSHTGVDVIGANAWGIDGTMAIVAAENVELGSLYAFVFTDFVISEGKVDMAATVKNLVSEVIRFKAGLSAPDAYKVSKGSCRVITFAAPILLPKPNGKSTYHQINACVDQAQDGTYAWRMNVLN